MTGVQTRALPISVIVSPAIEPSKTLSSQLLNACAFIDKHQPVLVCSSSPRLPALVVAAYVHRKSSGATPILDALASAERSMELVSDDSSSCADKRELEAFETMLKKAEEDEDEGLDDAPFTPRLQPTQALKKAECGPAPLAVVGSYDSTMTDFRNEFEVETPTKRARGNDSPTEMVGDSLKRPKDAKLSPPPPPPLPPPSSIGTYKSFVYRGSCTRCEQESVLGWLRTRGEGSSSNAFECCACHDACDDEIPPLLRFTAVN